MKKLNHSLLNLIIAALLLFSISSAAQDCEPYIPMDEGVEFETQSFNHKGKLQSTSKQKIISKTVNGGNLEATIHSELYDKKDNLQSTLDYKIMCKDGVFMVDMSTMLDPEQTKEYQGADIIVDGDFLELPSVLTVGQSLNGGVLNVKIGSEEVTMLTIKVTVSNRKVEAKEKITTPAGTFECYKISFDIETRFIFKIKMTVKEWYSKGVGMVRTESYNKSGKMTGYTILTSFKN